MSRKDYVLIAEALKLALEQAGTDSVAYGVKLAALRATDALALDNPRFKRLVFLKAVGVDDEAHGKIPRQLARGSERLGFDMDQGD